MLLSFFVQLLFRHVNTGSGIPKLFTIFPVCEPGIIKGAFVIPVRQAVCLDLFRDGGRIFAEKSGDIFKGCAFVQFIFEINTDLLIEFLLLLLSEGEITIPLFYERVNIKCVGVNSTACPAESGGFL